MYCPALVGIAVLMPVFADAQSAHQVLPGARLSLGVPCVRSATITRDPVLTGQVVVDERAANQGEIDQLTFSGGDTASLKVHHDCWRPSPLSWFRPSLALSIRVPPGFPVNIDASGDGDYHLDVGGPLVLDSSGSARLDATEILAFHAEMSGSGHVTVRQVTGPIHADISGSGAIAIANAATPALDLDLSGSGRFSIAGGSVSALNVDSSGSGTVTVGGTVDTASIDISGSGNVELTHVTGALQQEASGSGKVTVKSR